MIKVNYHTHCRYCHHASGEVIDYVRYAIDHGFKELGMTDHNPVIENLCQLYGPQYAHFASNMTHEDVDLYLNDINECKKLFKDQIKIYSGFECEFLSKGLKSYQKLRSKSDYLILGVHYFEMGDEIVNTYGDTSMNYKTIKYYADTCIKGMESGLFNVLAHPDLFMYHYNNKDNKRQWDKECEKASIRIIEAAIKNNVYLEINANGLRTYGANQDYHDWNYPYYKFWEIVKKYPNVKILIGADAHNPKNLDNINVTKVIEFAKNMCLKVQDKMEINH